MKRTDFGMLCFLLIGVMVFTFRLSSIEAIGTIYIRADGSIDPSTANITSADNVTYYFTDNNYYPIVIERDNIILDGVGYTLQGTVGEYGIHLTGRGNVTLNNIRIKTFDHGIRLDSSSNNTVSGSNIAANNGYGILLVASSNNTVSGNNVTSNEHGIRLYKSSKNTISRNNITANDRYGIRLYSSSNYNIISGNNITESLYGISLSNSSNNAVLRNTIAYNAEYGIGFESYSINNTISRNNIIANYRYGIRLDGSSNCIISQNNITANSWLGIWLYYSSNNTFSGNDIRDNAGGIWFFYSSNNSISRNNITANYWDSYGHGLRLSRSSNNTFYHNNFVENGEQVLSDGYGNVWDDGYPSGGNYWSDGTHTDANEDWISDIPYIINENNTDHYPLMSPLWYWRNPIIGDLNWDMKVNMHDIAIAASAFGSYTNHPRWNPNADIDKDNKVDIRDIGLIARNFGETDP